MVSLNRNRTALAVSIDDPDVIDFVTEDPTGHVVLVMVEGRQWDGSDDRLTELDNKINTYASFVFEKELVAKYPDLAGKPIVFELRCVDAPDSKTARFLATVSEKLKKLGVQFDVRQIGIRPSA